jgi:hypothetical protein
MARLQALSFMVHGSKFAHTTQHLDDHGVQQR